MTTLTKEILLKMAEGQMKAFHELWDNTPWYDFTNRRLAKVHLAAAAGFSKKAEAMPDKEE